MTTDFDKLDESVFLKLNGWHHEFLDLLMLTASNKFSFIPLFILCIIITVRYFKKQKEGYHPYINYLLLISVLSLQLILCFNILPAVFKNFFPMERPCSNPDLVSFIRLLGTDCSPTPHSFFGYKSCLVFCFTSFLFFTVKEGYIGLKVLLVIWCLIVSYSRIYVGAHYPINILLSDIIGAFIGYLGYRFYIYLRYNLFVI
ncbi:MAG: phosphatase PAP2 family protein [Bacteroidia bacterium]